MNYLYRISQWELCNISSLCNITGPFSVASLCFKEEYKRLVHIIVSYNLILSFITFFYKTSLTAGITVIVIHKISLNFFIMLA